MRTRYTYSYGTGAPAAHALVVARAEPAFADWISVLVQYGTSARTMPGKALCLLDCTVSYHRLVTSRINNPARTLGRILGLSPGFWNAG